MRRYGLNRGNVKGISVLCVDSEVQSRRLIRYGLEVHGYAVMTANSGDEAISQFAKKTFDMVTTEINLGDGPDGIEFCRTVRERCKTPIVVITEDDNKRTKLAALGAGADDYVTKPFDIDELEARIRAILRRTAIADGSSVDGEIRADGLVINVLKHRVSLDGEEIYLTPREFALLRVLASNPGTVVPHSTLLKEVWHKDEQGSENLVRVYINKLRKKLGECSSSPPRYIFNELGVGYRFVDM